MFTGIIEKKGIVLSANKKRRDVSVEIAKPSGWKLKPGQSISIDGVCSTVARLSQKSFEVQYMPETISKTTAGLLQKNSVVNLERSLTLASFVDGHLVQGHVDARAKVTAVRKNKDGHLVTIGVPKELQRFVAEHGSIAINGVSLTVARMQGNNVTLALIPFTLEHTNLGSLKKGDWVNIEVDLLARYSAKLLSHGRLSNAKKGIRKKD